MANERNSQQLNSATRGAYPFAAIVGQAEMKLALLLNVIDPAIGGVLLMGHRGTGKSTVVRALADLLPPLSVVSGCTYQCDPADAAGLCSACSGATTPLRREQRAVSVVELPLGATEDRVCGTIDIEQALAHGHKRFEPGLLARANRGFLYIDEVNLLEDHLVDLLLDVAVTGVNKVERESISLEHPARFVLIGSGNPEEGELRPQLLDRFGLFVAVTTEAELDQRIEIVARSDAFERDRAAFNLRFATEQAELRRKVVRARRGLNGVKVSRAILSSIAALCVSLEIEGHRGELTITRAGRALAAWEKRKQVVESDVRRVAAMALRHRLRREALDEAGTAEQIEAALDQVFRAGRRGSGSNGHEPGGAEQTSPASGAAPELQPEPLRRRSANKSPSPNGIDGGQVETEAPATSLAGATIPQLKTEPSRARRSGAPRSPNGRRQTAGTNAIYDRARGRYSRAVALPATASRSRVAVDATLRAMLGVAAGADLSGSVRLSENHQRQVTPVSRAALRFKLFKRKPGRLFILALDLSGSMALNRIAQAKGLLLELLRQSYVKRDHVAVVGFRGTTAHLMLSPTRSVLRARRVLDALAVGGGTPLSAGLACVLELARGTQGRQGQMMLLLFTDGHANVPLDGQPRPDRQWRRRLIEAEAQQLGNKLRKAGVRTVLIDTQNGFAANDEALRLAQSLGAQYQALLTGKQLPRSERGWSL